MTARHLSRRDRFELWFGFLGAPAAWSAHLLIGYGYEEMACSTGTGVGFVEPLIATVTAVLGAAAALATVAAHRTWRRAERGEVVDDRGRVAFMGRMGTWWSGIFLLIILMGGGMLLLLDACVAG